jgi:hypothetical protein
LVAACEPEALGVVTAGCEPGVLQVATEGCEPGVWVAALVAAALVAAPWAERCEPGVSKGAGCAPTVSEAKEAWAERDCEPVDSAPPVNWEGPDGAACVVVPSTEVSAGWDAAKPVWVDSVRV